MSRIFGEPPRKPLRPEERAENARRRAACDAANRELEEAREAIRAKYADAGLEDDEYAFTIYEIQGEFDVENFTEADRLNFGLMQAVALESLRRVTIVWPDITPKEPATVTWKRLP